MPKNKYLFIFFIILGISTIACSIKTIPPNISVPPTQTMTPIATSTCTNPVPPTLIGTVNVAEGLNFRKEPNEHSAVIVTLPPNSRVEILSEEENGWLCVKVEIVQKDMSIIELIGYVNGDYVDY